MLVPEFWKSELSEIDDVVSSVKKGRVSAVRSAGGRDIYLIEYGKRNEFKRLANYSSACGAGDLASYADKEKDDIRPTVFLVGSIHGAELEGTSALLNLISLIETRKDLSGRENRSLSQIADETNLLIIPCVNPDGRARFPKKSAVGMTFDEFRYYAQGTWKNGQLAGWPNCKKVHPIKDAAGFLGAYYNDNGVNMMHDNFSFPMAEETKFLLKVADSFVPDVTVLLHGCADAKSEMLMPNGVHKHFKDEAYRLSKEQTEQCGKNNINLTLSAPLYGDDEPVHSYNLVSAVTNICGELCVVYECNQGLAGGRYNASYEDMYKQHMILFEVACEYAKKKLKVTRSCERDEE